MGIAQYDPAALGRPAWNAGRKVGVKKPDFSRGAEHSDVTRTITSRLVVEFRF